MADVAFLPVARQEYEEAHAWYRARSERAAAGFEERIEQALERIAEAPEWWPAYDERHRSYLLKRYPYVLIYRIVSGQVLIVAVAHAKRRPGYWKDRE